MYLRNLKTLIRIVTIKLKNELYLKLILIKKFPKIVKTINALNTILLLNLFLNKDIENQEKKLKTCNQIVELKEFTPIKSMNSISSIFVEGYQSGFINNVVQIIETNISEDINVEIISKELNLTRHTFLRKIKKHTGYTAIGFIKQYRLQYASKMLQNQEYNIKEVAYLSGFKSLSYFYSEFKTKYKIPPKKFKELYS
ncbi:helix-turn-helix domain-containing protein [Aquimarina longa]|uniref:helix-turn-helix domain-containing protein n=1 Tax=Aquimarina longa TaxID=1080221 RepID=UPI00130E6AE6|nr:AraC family transcriptional regulator [Aquimarina longa]